MEDECIKLDQNALEEKVSVADKSNIASDIYLITYNGSRADFVEKYLGIISQNKFIPSSFYEYSNLTIVALHYNGNDSDLEARLKNISNKDYVIEKEGMVHAFDDKK